MENKSYANFVHHTVDICNVIIWSNFEDLFSLECCLVTFKAPVLMTFDVMLVFELDSKDLSVIMPNVDALNSWQFVTLSKMVP